MIWRRNPSKIIPVLILLSISTGNCVRNTQFDSPNSPCEKGVTANATFEEVRQLYSDGTLEILEDMVIEGYINSTDEAGNFFSSLHFQDSPADPSSGLQIDIDLRDSHLFYGLGKKVLIRLKGLYLGKSKGVYKLGGAFTSFGTLSVGRLPANLVKDHVLISCDPPATMSSIAIHVDSLSESLINVLVELQDVQVNAEELEQPYALPGMEVGRILEDCRNSEITLLNSGYSDFHEAILPDGRGSATGVLYKDGVRYQLLIRDTTDLLFTLNRCNEADEWTSSNEVFISELADPENESAARFAELYNAGVTAISLEGWQLKRYTNDNMETGSLTDLSGIVIGPKETLVLSPDAEAFTAVYGFAPDIVTGANSPADSNGDDNLQLADAFGIVIDTFGRLGEDGSGTDHEFEDGRAQRQPGINSGNSEYDFSEWIIYNDTGAAGTINSPKQAPMDFTPGQR